MPELPDVEHLRRVWDEHLTGARVRAVVVTDEGILRGGAGARDLDAALRGRRFLAPDRTGKWLLARTDGPTALLHFGMDGGLVWATDAAGRHPHDRAVFQTDRGEMRFRNMRKLGGLWLALDEGGLSSVIGAVGPDVLGMGAAALSERLRRRRGQAKAALMDQRVIAGIGNLLADEILWQAWLHPKRRLETLDDGELARLVSATRRVVAETVRRYDTFARRRTWLWGSRGREGAGCPRCGTPLARTVAAGRTTWLCATCQPAPDERGGAPGPARRP